MFNHKVLKSIPVLIFFFLLVPPKVFALESARSEAVGDDLFLGGAYIELGIRGTGRFGTNENKPSGFFGTDTRSNIGMSTDPDGFNNGEDIKYDFFLPGSPEERWVIGYYLDETKVVSSNLSGFTNAITNTSAGNILSATSLGTHNSNLKIQQDISFSVNDKFFKNEVTLTNVSESNTLDSVRYMRSFDPDNTVDEGGSYDTRNEVKFRYEEDGKEAVEARTFSDTDPVYLATGSRSPIIFYSSDSRARASTFGFGNGDPYVSAAYDSPEEKGNAIEDDQAITIAFDVGDLAPGEFESFVYYTSLDSRDFEEVVEEIEEAEAPIPVNASPQVIVNNKLTVNQGETKQVLQSFLKSTDDTSSASQLIYTITKKPTLGDLYFGNTRLEVGNTFTQKNINDGSLSYKHNNSQNGTLDSFKFKVKDVDNAESSVKQFDFGIIYRQSTIFYAVTPEKEKPKEVKEPKAAVTVVSTADGKIDVKVKISDDGGEPMVKHKVYIKELDLNIETDELGEISLESIPPGEYSYTVIIDDEEIAGTFTVLGDSAVAEVVHAASYPMVVDEEEEGSGFNLLWICCSLPLIILLILLLYFAYKRYREEREKRKGENKNQEEHNVVK